MKVCLVKSLGRLVNHILTNGGTDTTLLCLYFHNEHWGTVAPADIFTRVRSTVKSMQLTDAGLDPDLIGAHLLRVGGAMALKLHGYKDAIIMKMGCWTSLTFLQYIHNQIAYLAHDTQKKEHQSPFC